MNGVEVYPGLRKDLYGKSMCGRDWKERECGRDVVRRKWRLKIEDLHHNHLLH